MLDLHFVLASASQNPQTGLRTQEAPQEAPRRANQEGRQEAPWEGPGRPPRRANIGQQEGARRPPRRARPKPPWNILRCALLTRVMSQPARSRVR